MNVQFKIATWNVERPNLTMGKEKERVNAINAELKKHPADILILTETNECISPGTAHVHFSEPLDKERGGDYYKDGERRIGIWSNFDIIERPKVTDPLTTTCAVLQTPYGKLAVFGSIIGIHGIFDKDFYIDLQNQIEDLRRFAIEGYNICYAGDFNISFSGRYRPNKKATIPLNDIFTALKMKKLTADIPENIDHIVISESFRSIPSFEKEYWNVDKKEARPRLSDHKGVVVTI